MDATSKVSGAAAADCARTCGTFKIPIAIGVAIATAPARRQQQFLAEAEVQNQTPRHDLFNAPLEIGPGHARHAAQRRRQVELANVENSFGVDFRFARLRSGLPHRRRAPALRPSEIRSTTPTDETRRSPPRSCVSPQPDYRAAGRGTTHAPERLAIAPATSVPGCLPASTIPAGKRRRLQAPAVLGRHRS